MKQYNIPEIDLVIVDLYPFEETVRSTNDEQAIIEKIDVGGPSMIRAAAKNFKNVLVIADKKDYADLEQYFIRKKWQKHPWKKEKNLLPKHLIFVQVMIWLFQIISTKRLL